MRLRLFSERSLPVSRRASRSPSQALKGRGNLPITRKRANTTSSGSDKRTANKICRVCGDKAFSYNFNVITCESCKAFFRRNALSNKEIRCPFNEQCEINVVSRRFCQRCRLAKCFSVGMKKEWIMSDEARLEKKARVEENRERRLQDALARENSEQREFEQNEMDTSSMDAPDSNSLIIAPEYVMPPVDDLMMQPLDIPQLLEPACQSHHLVDSIPTTAAHSLADVSATTTVAITMDVDPSTTMSGSGFIPPSLPIENMPTSIAVAESSLMAQAQLAAHVQVQAALNQHQAAINQQHQIAAAVVAHQVAQMTGAPAAAPPSMVATGLTQSLPGAIPAPALAPNLAPALAPSILAPSLAPSLTQNLNPSLAPSLAPALPPAPPALLQGLPGTDMVTIPREMLVQLIENNQNNQRAANCTCTCLCGRYPPGSIIVDEVTKDLLSASANATTSDARDETKLDTAEDLQLNGLLPSDESSVQWLNSCPPLASCAISSSEEVRGGRRGSLYGSLRDVNDLRVERLVVDATSRSSHHHSNCFRTAIA